MAEISGTDGMNPLSPSDPAALRRVFGRFVTGVTIVTTVDQSGSPIGLTVNSFSSVSLDPPLILWSLALAAKSLDAFRQSRHFAVNILAEDQADIARSFAKKGAEKFAQVACIEGRANVPLISGAVAHLECDFACRYPGGDHEIIVGRVVRSSIADRVPLLFDGGRFTFSPAGPTASDQPPGGAANKVLYLEDRRASVTSPLNLKR